ncbi:MAG TPA: AsmA-like C-terminal domain-containing protein [Candidatus Binatia bacterium]
MRKALKLVGFLTATLVLFFIVASLAFYHLVRIGEVRRFIVEEIEKQTDLKVQLAGADLEIGWITGVVFRNVVLSEPGQAVPALIAERVTARVALRPLLRRQVVFYQIHLTRPVAHLVRDRTGRIPLLDKLLTLPFLKQYSSDFSFDVRSVVVNGAKLEWRDASVDGQRTWQLINGQLEVERVRGEQLRQYLQTLLKSRPQEFAGLGLRFDLKTVLMNDGAKMNIASNGYVVVPRESLDFRQARWNAELEVVGVPAVLAKDLLMPGTAIRTISGHLAERMHIEGNPLQQLRLRGNVEFKQLSIDAPTIFAGSLQRSDGRIGFDLERSADLWRLQRLDFLSPELRFSLNGEISGANGSDPRLRLNLSTLPAPISVLRNYAPLKLIESPWGERLAGAVESGQFEIKKASVNARLSEFRELARGIMPMGLSLETEFRDISVRAPSEKGLALRALAGRIYLANRRFALQGFSGVYGDSRFTASGGTYDLSSPDGGKLELYTRADVNLGELKDQLIGQELAPRLRSVLASLEELEGRSRIELSVKRADAKPLQFDGKMSLDKVRGRYNEYALHDVQGDLAFDEKDFTAEKIRAQLNGSPVQGQIAVKDYNTVEASFDLSVESGGVRAGVLTSLLLDTGSPRDSGVVSGAIRYTGSLANEAQRKLTGTLDFVNVQMRLKPLLQPLRALNGRVTIDETGIDFQKLSASLVGFPVSATGRWRYGQNPQLLFDFVAPNLDITYLISQIDPELSDFYATLVADGKITLNQGRIKNFEFSDLSTSASIDHRVWRLTNLRARSAGGEIRGVTTIFDKPDTLAIVADPKIDAVPIQSFLNWFNLNTTEMSGKVSLNGKLETVGMNDPERKRNLNGAFSLRIEDGTIKRMRIVVQLLNLLDLSRWFTFQMPDLTKQGIRFRTITADFKVSNGIYFTDNLIVDSSDLRMTGAGKIDVPNDELDFVVAVRPFAGIDAVISYIPLLGRGVAAIKNSLLVASFNITGHIDEPTITPAPLGTLSEWFWGVLGIPKNIIGFGESEKKELAQPATEEPLQ